MMREWMHKPSAKVLAVVLTVLLILNLIPSESFRAHAEEYGPARNVYISADTTGNDIVSVSGQLILSSTETGLPVTAEPIAIENGAAVIPAGCYYVGKEYTVSVSIEGATNFCYYDAANDRYLYSPDDFTEIFDTSGSNIVMYSEVAQPVTRGGFVFDAASNPLEGVAVSVVKINGQAPVNPITAVTDSTGKYTLTVPDVSSSWNLEMTYTLESYQTEQFTDRKLPTAGGKFPDTTLTKKSGSVIPDCGENGMFYVGDSEFTLPRSLVYGEKLSVTIVPNDGYRIESIYLNETAQPFTDAGTQTIELSNLEADCTLKATFVSADSTSYQVKVSVGENGSVKCGEDTVTSAAPAYYERTQSNAEFAYTVTPDAGYSILNVSVNGVSKSLTKAQRFGFSDTLTISAMTRVNVTFEAYVDEGVDLYIDKNEGGDAVYLENGAESVKAATFSSQLELVITPADGYYVSAVEYLDGTSRTAVTDSVLRGTDCKYHYAIPSSVVDTELTYAVTFTPMTAEPITDLTDSSLAFYGNIASVGFLDGALLYPDMSIGYAETFFYPDTEKGYSGIQVNSNKLGSAFYASASMKVIDVTIPQSVQSILVLGSTGKTDDFKYYSCNLTTTYDNTAPTLSFPDTGLLGETFYGNDGIGSVDAKYFRLSFAEGEATGTNETASGVDKLYYCRGFVGSYSELLTQTYEQIDVRNSASYDFEVLENGEYTFVVTDRAGNASAVKQVELLNDFTAPEITSTVLALNESGTLTDVKQIDSSFYYNGDTLYLLFGISDAGAGAKELLLYTATQGGTPALYNTYDATSGQVVIPLTATDFGTATELSVVVKDKVGNATERKLLAECGLSLSSVMVAEDSVSITIDADGESFTKPGSPVFYRTFPSLSVTLTDQNGLALYDVQVKEYNDAFAPVSSDANGKSLAERIESGSTLLFNNTVVTIADNKQYTVVVSAKSILGENGEKQFDFRLDTIAPVLQNASVAPQTNYTANYLVDNGVYYTDVPLVLTLGAYDDGCGIAKYELYNGDSDTPFATLESSQGTESFMLPGPEEANASVSYELSVVLTDALGNRSEKLPISGVNSDCAKIVITNQVPQATATPEAVQTIGEELWITGSNGNVSLQMSDEVVGLKKIDLTVNGADAGSKTYTDFPASDSLTLDLLNYTPDADGAYELSLTVTNRLDRSSTVTLKVYLDDGAPAVQQFAIASETGKTLYTDASRTVTNGVLLITVTATDGDGTTSAAKSGVKTITLLMDGEVYAVSPELESGVNQYTFTVPVNTLEAGTSVKHVFSAKATDRTGNEGTVNGLSTTNSNLLYTEILFENIAPQISYELDLVPVDVNGALWIPDGATLTITVEETDSLLSRIVLTNADGSTETYTATEILAQDSDCRKYSISLTPENGQSDGAHTYKVTATDIAGNEATQTYTVYVDKTNPKVDSFEIVPVDTPDSLQYLRFGSFASGKVKVLVKVSDEAPSAGIKLVSLFVNGAMRSVEPVNGVAEFILPENAVTPGMFEQYTIYAMVTDMVGNGSPATSPSEANSNAKSDKIVIENGNPTAGIVVDSCGQTARTIGTGAAQKTWYSNDILWKVSVQDTEGGIGTVKILLNGQELTTDSEGNPITRDFRNGDTPVASVNYTFSTAQVAANADCSYKLSVQVTDNAKNTSEVYENTVYLDGVNPTVNAFEVSKADSAKEMNGYPFGVYSNGVLLVKVTTGDAPAASEPVSGTETLILYVNDTVFSTVALESGRNDYTFTLPVATLPDNYCTTMKLAAEVVDASGLHSAKTALTTGNSNLKSDTIMVENKVPTAKITLSEEGKKLINGVIWYGAETKFTVSVQDADSMPAKLELLVNGKQADVQADGTPIPTDFMNSGTREASLEYVLNTADYTAEDGSYTIAVRVTDAAGNVSSDEIFFRIDRHVPKIDGFSYVLSDEADTLQYLKFGTFANGKLMITLQVSDEAPSAGLDTIAFKLNGVTYTAPVQNGAATFEIPKSAVTDGFSEIYTMSATVTDVYGKVCGETTLNKALNGQLKNDALMIERVLPVITVSTTGDNHANVSGKDWYSSDVNWSIRIQDGDAGIGSVEVKINNQTITADKNGKNISEAFGARDAVSGEENFLVSTSQAQIAEDGSYTITIVVTDNAGNVSKSYTETVYKDTAAPEIIKFRFATEGFVEGSEEEAGVTFTDYGFYFTKDATVYISAFDAAPASGVKSITYYLNDIISGVDEPVTVNTDENGEISVVMHAPFKGQIYAKSSDFVNNTGDYVTPKSAIVENDDNHDAEKHIIFTKETTDRKQANGTELYAQDVPLNIQIVDRYSGIRTIEWSVVAPYDQTRNQSGSVVIGNDGSIEGDTGWVKDGVDSNLVTVIAKTITVANDSNDIVIKVKMTDRAGNETTDEITFGIDKTTPAVDYVFDNNEGDDDYPNVYDAVRTMTLTVTERNFNAADFVCNIRNTDGTVPTLSAWTENRDTVDPNRTTYTATVFFQQEGNFTVNLALADRAGNNANIAPVQNFVIDMTRPVIQVEYDNNSVRNGNFYNKERNATVTVIDRNFDVSRISFTGNAQKTGNWFAEDGKHSIVISFTEDGMYALGVTAMDKAGNVAEPYTEAEYIIDMTAPVVELLGIEDANRGTVAPVITCCDENFIEEGVQFELVRTDGRTLDNTYTVEDYISGEKTGLKFSYRNFDTMKETDGIYTFTITVTDKAGNVSKPIERTFSVNRYGSTYDMSQLTELNGTYTSRVGDIVFHEINVDDITQDKVEITILRNNVPTRLEQGKDYTIETISAGAKKWSEYRYTIKKEVFEQDGEYSVLVVSVDRAGNINENNGEEKNAMISFCVDKVAPNVIIISPAEQTVYSQASLDASLEIRDNYKLSSVKILLNGKEIPFGRNGSIYTFTVPESDSRQNLQIVATDAAGNASTVEVREFLVSTNFFVRFINNTGAVVGTSVGLLAGLSGVLVFLVRKRKKLTA